MSILSENFEPVKPLRDLAIIEWKGYDFMRAWEISEENGRRNKKPILKTDCDKAIWKKNMTPNKHIVSIMEELGNIVVVENDLNKTGIVWSQLLHKSVTEVIESHLLKNFKGVIRVYQSLFDGESLCVDLRALVNRKTEEVPMLHIKISRSHQKSGNVDWWDDKQSTR